MSAVYQRSKGWFERFITFELVLGLQLGSVLAMVVYVVVLIYCQNERAQKQPPPANTPEVQDLLNKRKTPPQE